MAGLERRLARLEGRYEERRFDQVCARVGLDAAAIRADPDLMREIEESRRFVRSLPMDAQGRVDREPYLVWLAERTGADLVEVREIVEDALAQVTGHDF